MNLVELREQFESELNEYLNALPNNNLHAPIKYILSLGGKRFRPILVLLSASAFGKLDKKTRQAALAVEIFHNFSLVHDDIMDEAPLRRGKKTVHAKWDENTAILSGDAMLIEAYKMLSLAGTSSNLKDLLDLFNKTSAEVCWGQQLDMDFEMRSDVDVESYIEMIGLKTAVLLGCALKMGAIVGRANKKDADLLYEFGKQAGIGFQIQDDYLDAFGDPKKFGKQIGGDIISNKKTILIIRALKMADEDLKKELSQIYFENSLKDQNEKVERVKEIFEAIGVDRETQQLSRDYFNRAAKCIDELTISDEKKNLFRDFLAMLEQRSY